MPSSPTPGDGGATDPLPAARRLHQAGDLAGAERLYRRLLRADPSDAHAWYLLGAACQGQGRPNEAEAALRESLRRRPHGADAHDLLGVVLARQGRLAEALDCFRRAAESGPDHAAAHQHLGQALRDLGRPAEARAAFERAVLLRPDSAADWAGLGEVLRQEGRRGEPVATFRRLAQARPGAEPLRRLGLALLDGGAVEEAGAALEEALRLRPDDALVRNAVGMLRCRQGRLTEGAAEYRAAVRLRPDFHEGHNNLGNALRDQGRFDEARAAYEAALRLKPDYAGAHWNRSLLRLLHGECAEGWDEYEWRWRLPSPAPRRFAAPAWDGEPLAGRTILVHAEQGLGDTLQFVRYLPLVRGPGATVVFECQRPLTRLLAGAAGVDRLLAAGDPLPPFDVHAPLLSLPRLFRTRLDSIPAGVPYLRPDARLAGAWREKLASLRGYRVGVAWQGNPRHAVDYLRSVPLARFAPLARVEGVRLIGLQKGEGKEQWRAAGFPVTDLGEELDEAAGPFMDTAAVMSGLDLVIASDSAVLHLAGATGVPAWAALPYVPDWRWLLGREDSPWYPTMRLFRQERPGDWEGVFGRMAAALERRLHERARLGPAP